MNKTVIAGIVVGSLTVGFACVAIWRNMSSKYIPRWDVPRQDVSGSAKNGGNVYIVSHVGAREHSTSDNVQLFPGLYQAIGTDEDRIVKWQDENGFDTGGVDRTGTLLAPGYPILSRLVWTIETPVYLEGDEVLDLLDELKRVSVQSSDPMLQDNVRKLSTLAEMARKESQALLFT